MIPTPGEFPERELSFWYLIWSVWIKCKNGCHILWWP